MDTLSIYKSIYNDVFCKTFNQTCYVFLPDTKIQALINSKLFQKEEFSKGNSLSYSSGNIYVDDNK